MINIGGRFAALAVFTVAFAALGNAQSVILISHTGNQYQYGLQVDASHGFGFAPGGQVSLTGLAGVTNASVLLETRLYTSTAPVITATSVSFNVTNSPVFDPAPFSFSLPLVSVTSPALPAGGQYQIQTAGGTISGSLPVSNPIRLAVWRPGNSTWYVNPIGGTPASKQLGLPEDIPVAADFNRDGALDYVLWQPLLGMWSYVLSNGFSGVSTLQWGFPGDIPMSGDFDGDGTPDYAVWRPSSGTWYIFPNSSVGPLTPIVKQWGRPLDIPIAADFDGDGKFDFAVWRPSEGNWYITFSSTGATTIKQWGLAGDIPVAADFDGDGKADYAVWRPSLGNWYIIPSSTGVPYTAQWGLPGDIPVPNTYDGDGKADLAVWRPSNGTWYILPSATPAAPLAIQWGLPGDVPIYEPAGQLVAQH